MAATAPKGSVAVLGAAGRMGSAIIRVISELPDLKLTAAVEKGSVNVVPRYHAFHWSMSYGLNRLPPSPVPMFIVDASRSDKSAVNLGDGPNPRPTWLTVVPFPDWGNNPGPLIRSSSGMRPKIGC